MHPSVNHFENTLANGVSWLCRQRNDYFPFRCVNRLDGGTTGLLILAKNVYSSAILYEQMKERKIHRTYLAIVSGKLTESETIDLPIGRKSESVIERCVDKTHGERAVTHYEVLEARTDQTLVKCQLETGRTHQIRVHMQAIGHPLVGDFLYNRMRFGKKDHCSIPGDLHFLIRSVETRFTLQHRCLQICRAGSGSSQIR